MTSYAIFVVDDEPSIRESIGPALQKHYQVKTFPQAEPALEAMEKGAPDMVLLDIGLPGMSGIQALEEIKRLYPEVLVLMVTANEDIPSVVSSMKLGAYDYVLKPLNMEGLLNNIANALGTLRMRKDIQELHERYLGENVPCIIGESNAIQNVMEVVNKVAKSPDTPVLILGETGTGKELIASAIHYKSPHFKGPMVTVNCAAIPRDLIESELFGYEKGAFSGAGSSGKKGLVEQAAGGTLFLDEVGDLSAEAQAKLLRFLEEGEFYKVGGTKKRRIVTKVVSATNRDLSRMAEAGEFRQDLYYRLAVVTITVPSLQDRREDIIPLSRHFLIDISKKLQKTPPTISPPAERALMDYRWKGNIRELRNVIERAVLVSDSPELGPLDLGLQEVHKNEPPFVPAGSSGFPVLQSEGVDFPSLLESFERHYLEESLRIAGGNESKAAQLLHVTRDTFRYRRKRLQIS